MMKNRFDPYETMSDIAEAAKVFFCVGLFAFGFVLMLLMGELL